jgi:hypothetical protein
MYNDEFDDPADQLAYELEALDQPYPQQALYGGQRMQDSGYEWDEPIEGEYGQDGRIMQHLEDIGASQIALVWGNVS